MDNNSKIILTQPKLVKVNIFFSWQSDKKGYANQIRKGLKRAKNLLIVEGIDLELVEATNKEVGSPSISDVIYKKIDSADFFVSDISITGNDNVLSKYYPNSNVMLETGYALARLGEKRVILFFNKNSGADINLPFDIRNNRYKPFSLDSYNKTTNCDAIANWVKLMIIPFKESNELNAELSMSDKQKEEYRSFIQDKKEILKIASRLNMYMFYINEGLENEASVETLKSSTEKISDALFELDVQTDVLEKMYSKNENAIRIKDICDDCSYKIRVFQTAVKELILRIDECRNKGDFWILKVEEMKGAYASASMSLKALR